MMINLSILSFDYNRGYHTYMIFTKAVATYTANDYRELQFFFCNMYGNGLKNHRETLYSSKGKIVYVVGNPCNIYRL